MLAFGRALRRVIHGCLFVIVAWQVVSADAERVRDDFVLTDTENWEDKNGLPRGFVERKTYSAPFERLKNVFECPPVNKNEVFVQSRDHPDKRAHRGPA